MKLPSTKFHLNTFREIINHCSGQVHINNTLEEKNHETMICFNDNTDKINELTNRCNDLTSDLKKINKTLSGVLSIPEVKIRSRNAKKINDLQEKINVTSRITEDKLLFVLPTNTMIQLWYFTIIYSQNTVVLLQHRKELRRKYPEEYKEFPAEVISIILNGIENKKTETIQEEITRQAMLIFEDAKKKTQYKNLVWAYGQHRTEFDFAWFDKTGKKRNNG